MPEIQQTVSPIGAGPAHSGAAARPMIEQSVSTEGVTRTSGANRPVIDQTVSVGGGGAGRVLSDSAREMLSNLDKYGSVRVPPEAQPETPETPVETPAKPEPTPEPAPEPAPETTPAAAATPAPSDEYRAVNERLTQRNAALAAEIESLKKQPHGEPGPREKALDAAERGYFDDNIGALRQFLATALGVDDPKHAAVDAELAGLYQDLTARELGIEPDPAQRAMRESARTKQLVAREQRERKAAAAPKPAEPAATPDHTAEHTQIIASRLPTIGATYPLTLKHAEKHVGMKPEALLLRVIREGFTTGEFDPNQDNDALIKQALEKTETYYRSLADMFGATASTAQPTPADAKANQELGQKQGARSITNASASVAPATPPAKQPVKVTTDDYRARKPGETEQQFRLRIAKHHMPD